MEENKIQNGLEEAAPTGASRQGHRSPPGGGGRRAEGGAASGDARHRRFTPEEKREAVEAFQKSEMSMDGFSRTWGVSKPSLLRWRRAYRSGGPKALESNAGRKKGKNRKPEAVREAVKEAKKANPWFGLRKVRDQLFRFKGLKVSTGTIRRELREAGIEDAPRKKRKRSSDKVRLFERAKPGELWQSDITSFVLPRSGQRVYLTVFLDDFSRYAVSWKLALRQTSEFVTECLLAGIDKYGKPQEVLTDQGRQYFSWRGKSEFQKLLDRQGIRHVVARSHHPQTVGKCERLWKTVGEELWFRVKPQDFEEAQKRIDHFFKHYCFQRPHQSLEGLVPADRFFGAQSQVREVLEKELEANELLLALGEEPRQAAYFVGRIGDQSVSLHGEKGQLVVTLPDGNQKTFETKDLGMAQGKEKTNENNYEGRIEQGGGEDRPPASQSALHDAKEGALAGAGIMGSGNGRGTQEGPRDLSGTFADVAGQEKPCGSGFEPGRAALAGVAAESAGFSRDGSGLTQAAQGEAEERGSCRWPRRGGAESQSDKAGETADER